MNSNVMLDHELRGLWVGDWYRINEGQKRRERSLLGFGEGQCLEFVDVEYARTILQFRVNTGGIPKEIDFLDHAGELQSLGIYEIVGDTLTICSRDFGERPTAFSSADLARLTVFKRVNNEFDISASDTELERLLVRELGEVRMPPPPTPPEQFDQVAEDHVFELFRKITERPFPNNESLYEALTVRERAVFLIVYMANAIDSDGFYQFMWSPIGGYAKDVIETLDRIGAVETRELVVQASNQFPRGMPSFDDEEREDEVDALSIEALETLRELTDQYYARDEDLFALLSQYWNRESP